MTVIMMTMVQMTVLIGGTGGGASGRVWCDSVKKPVTQNSPSKRLQHCIALPDRKSTSSKDTPPPPNGPVKRLGAS